MAKRVRMPELGGDPCRARVALKEMADRALRERFGASSSPAEEIAAGIGRSNIHVSMEEPLAASMKRVPVCISALEPPDPDVINAHIGDFHERSFPASKSMAIHKVEQKQVADIRLRNLREERLHLFSREELDG